MSDVDPDYVSNYIPHDEDTDPTDAEVKAALYSYHGNSGGKSAYRDAVLYGKMFYALKAAKLRALEGQAE